jgi:hypothetical protein
MTARPLLPPDVSGLRLTPSGPSRSVCRALGAIALSALQREDALKIVKAAWPNDISAETIVRATISPTSTSNSGVSDLLASGFGVLSIAPQSASTKLFQQCLRLNFDGVHTIVVSSSTTTPAPAFVAEGSPHPIGQNLFTSVTAGPVHKLLIGAVIMRELESATPETAATVIARALSGKSATTLDSYVFDNVAASSTRPAGLLNGLSTLGATAGGGLSAIVGDLGKIADNAAAAGGDPDSLMLFCGVTAAIKLRLQAGPRFDYPIIGTTALGDDSIVGIIPSGVYSGFEGTPSVETSREATVVMEDASVEALSAGGTVADSARSLWQTDSFALWIRQKCAWGVLVSGAVSLITGVSW